MTNHPFRWAFIGAGTLAKQVAKEITASGNHKIVCVYTRNPEKCAAFAAEYGALAAKSAERAISAPEVEGVYIVTPHTSHFAYAKLALELGKSVLCEKPVTTDAKQAAELAALSQARGVYFAEAMWTWFSPIANQVKAWLDAGEYGEIRSMHANYRMNSINYAPRVSDPNLAGGALLDVGIYPITYIYRLFGKPERITCTGTLKDGIDLCEDVTLEYPGGKRYTASASIVDFKGLERVKLRGTKGSTNLFLFHMANKVSLRRGWRLPLRCKGYGGMRNEFDLVAREIREGLVQSRYVPHKATVEVMQILDECRRQMGLVYPFEQEHEEKI